MNAILEEIRRQAHWSGEFDSPFNAALLTRIADDLEAGGIVARLVEGWSGNPRVDAVSLRIAGALHAAVLTGRDARLAAQYPAAAPGWSMDAIWTLAEAFLKREAAWVRAFMASPPPPTRQHVRPLWRRGSCGSLNVRPSRFTCWNWARARG